MASVIAPSNTPHIKGWLRPDVSRRATRHSPVEEMHKALIPLAIALVSSNITWFMVHTNYLFALPLAQCATGRTTSHLPPHQRSSGCSSHVRPQHSCQKSCMRKLKCGLDLDHLVALDIVLVLCPIQLERFFHLLDPLRHHFAWIYDSLFLGTREVPITLVELTQVVVNHFFCLPAQFVLQITVGTVFQQPDRRLGVVGEHRPMQRCPALC
mmetsp:Transcript_11080/g.30587  ORF Transcript_11080/g.30587 Transcript_11080/m.30587 type:complete len:211 (+) Transcript_11080:71-703(+)